MPKRWFDPAFFTDEKMKRATVPERLLAAAIIANQDDDGRLRGDPAYLRAIAFLYDDYRLDEVKAMRDHLAEVNPNIIVHENAGDEYIQLRHHRRYQKPRYYHPSKFPAPPDWPFKGEIPSSNQRETKQQPSGNHSVTEEYTEGKGEGNNLDLDLDKDKGRGIGKGTQTPSPSLTGLSLFNYFNEVFPQAFGRKPDSRESAQLRDLGKEISSAGGVTAEQVYDAFKEAATQNIFHISYIRKILHAWLGLERGPP